MEKNSAPAACANRCRGRLYKRVSLTAIPLPVMKLPERIVFATNNQHKLAEARAIFASLEEQGAGSCRILSLNDIDCHEDIDETASTLEGNALIKARWVHDRYGIDCFADDTGLEVEALGGAPGVMSARFAAVAGKSAESHDSKANMNLLLEKLEGVANRNARFRTCIALIAGGEEHLFEGLVNGAISTAPEGREGFGYDPVFVPDGCAVSFAQMSPEQKNSISHRGRALAALMNFFKENN